MYPCVTVVEMENTMSHLVSSKWLIKPKPGHMVQFYPFESALKKSLYNYIGTGLLNNETCIVIATKEHLKALNSDLKAKAKVDVVKARRTGQYIALDAAETLASFMIDGSPNWEKFVDVIGSLASKAEKRGQPIRAYGEMVALLWQQGDISSVIKLEDFWNDLAKVYSFSLFCAYPQIHFDMEMHSKEHAKIRAMHNLLHESG